MRNEECKHGRTQREIDQIAGQAVGDSLYRSPRLFCAFDRVDDLSKRGVAAQPGHLNFQRAGLVNRARIHRSSPRFLSR